jgi:hypothetical protein
MTRYWIKIAAGAILIFALGMAVWFGVRRGVGAVHVVMDTDQPISIPIKFATFRLDGIALGKIDHIRLMRSAPKRLVAAEITVRLDSAAYADRLRGCVVRLNSLDNLDEHTTFVCSAIGDSSVAGAFEPFGQLIVEGTNVAVPLMLPASDVRDMKNGGSHVVDSVTLIESPPALPAPPAVKVTP